MTSRSQQQGSRRPPPNSPPSPEHDIQLGRVNKDFYSAPTFDERKKPSYLPQPPSPTSLDIHPLPDDASSFSFKEGSRNRSSNSVSPVITNSKLNQPTSKSTHNRPKSSQLSNIAQLSLRSPYSDGEEEEVGDEDNDEDDYQVVTINDFHNHNAKGQVQPQPYVVNHSDIKRPSSRNLSEGVQRGLARLGEFSTSREGSPIPMSDDKNINKRIEELSNENSARRVELDQKNREILDLESNNSQLQATVLELQRQKQDLLRHRQDLEQKLEKKEKDYNVMSKNYLDHVRMIRATDDDHSTILDKLNNLKVSIEHLVRKIQGTKSANLNKAVAIDQFNSSGLLGEIPSTVNLTEPFLLNLYMESVIMSKLVTNFFDKPLSCVFDYNSGFKDIYEWMFPRNHSLAVRWRQQLCVMLTQDPEAKVRQEQLVTRTTNELVETISKIYSNFNEAAKIREICCKSFELSVAMAALETVISPAQIQPDARFDEETMTASNKSNMEGRVGLIIFPAFKDHDGGFYVKPKVWCY
ncbi:hypothetical protein BGZ76_002175 [Entomortierella beljakovae]|nr:hypothetical protein BGZ76_002175 [Entomortierella beljakovae]